MSTSPAVSASRATSPASVRSAVSQIYHYFESKQALIQAVITRHSDTTPVPVRPMMDKLDSFQALRAWADAAIARLEENDCRNDCTLPSLAGELGGIDDSVRQNLSDGFLHWQSLLHDALRAMPDRGELRADADLDELSLSLLTALQGGTVLRQTLRSYVRSFTAAPIP